MKTIEQSYVIHAPVEKVWQALTRPEIIKKWSGEKALMSEDENSAFSLWGGDIHGINTKIIKNHEIVQDWYGGKWNKPSKVSIKLSSVGGDTEVDLRQEDVPDEEAEDIEDGWKQFYFGPMLDLLEASENNNPEPE